MNTDLSLKNKAISKTNIFFLIGLSISIPASKAGMNAFLYLYVLSSFALLSVLKVNLSSAQKTLLRSSLAVFIIGALLSIFSKGSDNDVVVFLQKYAYLLVPIAFVITTQYNHKALKWSLVAFLLSVGVCLIIDLYQFAVVYDFFRENAKRLWGQIGYSRWPIVLVTAISVVLTIELNKTLKRSSFACLISAFIMLFGIALSGTKGGFIAAGIVGVFYLAIKARKHWKVIPIALILGVITMNSSVFQASLGNRFDIDVLKKAESTVLRVQLLKTGAAVTEHNVRYDLNYVLFGSGIEKPEVPFQNALDQLSDNVISEIAYEGVVKGHTDIHNSYLDQLLKNGLVFSLLFYALITFFIIQAYHGLKTVTRYQHLPTMFTGTLLAYGIFNCFYSNFADYAIYSQVYLLALALALPSTLKKERVA